MVPTAVVEISLAMLRKFFPFFFDKLLSTMSVPVICRQDYRPPQDASFSHVEANLRGCNFAQLQLRISDLETLLTGLVADFETRLSQLETQVTTLQEQTFRAVINLAPLTSPTTSYSLSPQHVATVYVIPPYTTDNAPVDLSFVIDNTGAQVGDEIILLFTNDATVGSGITLNVPQPTFYVAKCGEPVTSFTLPVSKKLAQYLVYNGISWVYTGDNC